MNQHNPSKSTGIPIGVFIVAIIIVSLVSFTFGVGLQNNASFQSFVSNQSAGDDKNLPENLDYTSVEEVYDKLREQYNGELDKDELLDGLKSGLVGASGDPYTAYLSAESAKEFEESLNGEFDGIGAEIATKNEQLQVVSPLPNTPAEKAGLRAGDPILKINDEDTQGMTTELAVSKIRGKRGTTVRLTIVRDDKPKEISIKRERIRVEDATGKVLPGKVGYIELRTFGDESGAQVSSIARDFKQQGITKVILDLRNNSGGLLGEAVDVAGVWLDGEVVVEERGLNDENQTLRAERNGVLNGTELVILINGGSASASEIVAGALHDHGVATLIGEKTFGKGSVQTLEELPNGGQLKVTVARWYTPNGVNIDKDGIKPDTEVKLSDEDFDKSRDPQLDAAKRLLK